MRGKSVSENADARPWRKITASTHRLARLAKASLHSWRDFRSTNGTRRHQYSEAYLCYSAAVRRVGHNYDVLRCSRPAALAARR